VDVNQALKLVRQYIFDRTGKRIRTNDIRIMRDRTQLDKLEQAVNIVREYYNGKK
tara:strand:- start:526 stop:690 length:165 start_codon:yes stop_codon:yes gene_type:complete